MEWHLKDNANIKEGLNKPKEIGQIVHPTIVEKQFSRDYWLLVFADPIFLPDDFFADPIFLA